ncbi:hypothetical protein [Desulfurococcus mucosus]|uniref:Uncharacterized protein n=1 Tax=Desulfurococcus mucosus (strain ATCC 35584 / DSM 2162 / JCM 9187 / O7/1) TaxID=765177 RepID=E8R7W6_DESM0|nr:hypothetical protein [Desulfurococcus mucosus]ADV64592.1 hypothetical protein Desmu_0273 [Desulfurococcus mucosus DSM 2162]
MSAVNLAERVMKSFSRYNCFIFEESELQAVKDLIVAAELKGLIEIRQLDPRYPYIYVATVWTKSIERDCVTQVNNLLSEGRLTQEEYKKYRVELVEQCMVSREIEAAKRVVEALGRYIERLGRVG